MKRFILIFLLLFSSICYSQNNSDSIIYWDNEYKLDCFDFRNVIQDTAKNITAISMVGIKTKGFWNNNLPDYMIYATFDRYASWNKDTTCSIIAHEQLHFDIAELYARKLRKQVSELRQDYNDNIQDYQDAIAHIFKEWMQTDSTYDEETHHGVYNSKQKEWNAKIATKIEKLKIYKVDYIEYIKKHD